MTDCAICWAVYNYVQGLSDKKENSYWDYLATFNTLSAWRCFEWTDKNGSNSKHQWYFSEIPAGKTFCWIKFLKEFDVKIWIFLLNRLFKKYTSKYQFGRWQNEKRLDLLIKGTLFFLHWKFVKFSLQGMLILYAFSFLLENHYSF